MRELSSPETAERVLEALRSAARAHPMGEARVGVRALAAELGIGRQTVLRALDRLASDERIRQTRAGTGKGYPASWVVVDGGSP